MQSILSIVIPTYGRDAVLVDSLRHLLALTDEADEVLVIDQSASHDTETESFLSESHRDGCIRWIRHHPPGTVGAMNRGVLEAKGDIVLFLDDDIIPDANLIRAHFKAYEKHPEAWAVVGQVIQEENAEMLKSEKLKMDTEAKDGEENAEKLKTEMLKLGTGAKDRGENAETLSEGCEAVGKMLQLEDGMSGRKSRSQAGLVSDFQRFSISAFFSKRASALRKDLDFPFNSTSPAWVENVMAGNLSVRRERFLQLGGFDANFTPPVSYRFETEFAKRLVAAGGRIRFEPAASIRHLRAPSGGTRSRGSHMSSASPIHGVGDYYYALLCGQGWDRVRYMARRPFREVRTQFHLRHPWWIPVKFVGELRAILAAWRLYRQGPKLLQMER